MKIAKTLAVSEIDWGPLYISGSAQESFTMFHSTLSMLHNKHFPKQTVKKKYYTRKLWLTDLLKDAIKKKNKLYMKSLKVKTTANEIEYKSYRNKLNHILRFAERKHFQDVLEKNPQYKKNLADIQKHCEQEQKKVKCIQNVSWMVPSSLLNQPSAVSLMISL